MASSSRMRTTVERANLPDKPFLVFTQGLLPLSGKQSVITDSNQPSFRRLQERCNRMAAQTLADALDHLERHGWIIRTRVGRRVFYTLDVGVACECRPGRGKPMSSAQRVAKHRASKRRNGTGDVTLNLSKDVTLNLSKDVTLNLSKDVTPNLSKDVTPNRSNRPDGCNTVERYKPQVRPPESAYSTDRNLEPTEVPGSAPTKDEPSGCTLGGSPPPPRPPAPIPGKPPGTGCSTDRGTSSEPLSMSGPAVPAPDDWQRQEGDEPRDDRARLNGAVAVNEGGRTVPEYMGDAVELKALKEQLGLTKAAIARMTGLGGSRGPDTVGRALAGRSRKTPEILAAVRAYADGLGAEPAELAECLARFRPPSSGTVHLAEPGADKTLCGALAGGKPGTAGSRCR